ncbi:MULTISPECIES: prephenate dehydrogenase/arogenate dehydrogenase family protein [Halobacterium]|uniref:prephenate dehydrogenase/arogenate dehydrogenase family protein n=1 Tax=Halobacterium TaxID=2239 RepID=UPI001F489742|nr:prephenate dehydrogenase/arogenate dehydrogenase family protein [Halobacterium salinarum]MCF2165107.1 prephenate dehydrogenase/arogenate dehydrogenase family protein [Halobacterium salinarum]MCF2168084.1 prephenate dehydrogenase/arogenate dehydrogenase family protein [Halobacterium salinarum]MCF2238290.1 prephenate dehydrogenase/arogenate dehydrogenase family protein [Halobacterium salinarum]
MEVLVVGAGAVGRWVAEVVAAPVAFADTDPQRAVAAADATENARAVAVDTAASFAVVAVAVPMRAAGAAIDAHAAAAERAIVDFTGVMGEPLAAMAAAGPPGVERASFHPLFAPAHAPGRIAVTDGDGGPAVDRLRGWLADAGNELVEVPAAVHDDAMETIQGRTHAAILAFALAADDVPDALATPVYEELSRLADRVTGGTPGVYADIQSTFGGSQEVAAAADRIAAAAAGDGDAFAEVYEDAS